MRAMSADAADMPVKPRMPAMIDTTKKIRAHFRSVTVKLLQPARPPPRHDIPDLTFSDRTGSSRRHRPDHSAGAEGAAGVEIDRYPLAQSPSRRQHRASTACWVAS